MLFMHSLLYHSLRVICSLVNSKVSLTSHQAMLTLRQFRINLVNHFQMNIAASIRCLEFQQCELERCHEFAPASVIIIKTALINGQAHDNALRSSKLELEVKIEGASMRFFHFYCQQLSFIQTSLFQLWSILQTSTTTGVGF